MLLSSLKSRLMLRNGGYLLIPCLSAPDLRYLNFSRMKEAGIKAICFDKDNLLTNHGDISLHKSLTEAWLECKRVFGNENMAIMSNSAGSSSDTSNELAISCESLLDVSVIRHVREKKPSCGELIFKHFQHQPHHIAMVGDRLMTDVVMGNLHEMLTIHTKPLSPKEPIGIRVMRSLENYLALNSNFSKLKSPIHPHRYYDPYLIHDHAKVKELYPKSLEISPIDDSLDWVCVDGLSRSELLQRWEKPASSKPTIAKQISSQSPEQKQI